MELLRMTIAPDTTFWKKAYPTATWTPTFGAKGIDVIQLPDASFVVVAAVNALWTCPKISIWTSCTLVPGSGSVKSIDVLSDGNTFIGVGMDNQLYTRNGLGGSWQYVPNSGYVVDITVLMSGVIVGTRPDHGA